MKNLFPPGLEPGTFRVLGERDNHYTTETWILESLFLIDCKSGEEMHKQALKKSDEKAIKLKKYLTTTGLEPTIFRSEVGRHIH